MTKVKKKDFIEISFKGTSNGNVFDTTNPEEAKDLGVEPKEIKPLILAVGSKMVLKGLDDDLEGKEIGKKYSVHIMPDKAFGPRNPQMIRTYGLNHFKKNDIYPQQGMSLQLDNQIVKVLSVSGGRVTVDFNNPLAGKEVDYEYTINKMVEDDKDKINSLLDFFLKQRFEFTIKGKKVIFKDEVFKSILPMIGPKFKEIIDFEFEVEENKEKKDEKKKEGKTEKKDSKVEKKKEENTPTEKQR